VHNEEVKDVETAQVSVGYFNWIWQHSRQRNTAAQRAALAITAWSWHDFLIYPTFY
jgi:insertion element IS1 protein InsB